MERAISRRSYQARRMARQVNLVPEAETEGINSMFGWIFSAQP